MGTKTSDRKGQGCLLSWSLEYKLDLPHAVGVITRHQANHSFPLDSNLSNIQKSRP